MQDGAVIGVIGANDHLRALPGRSETRCTLLRAGLGLALVDGVHGLLDGQHLFFRGQANQAALGRQLDVHAEPVGMAPGFGDQQRSASGIVLRWM